MRACAWKNDRPELTIETIGGAKLGRCYYSMTYRVTSCHKLDDSQIHALAAAGFLGYGQEFYIRERHEPAGMDRVPCRVFIDGVPTDEPPINEYSGTLHQPVDHPFYVYLCERRVDSGD